MPDGGNLLALCQSNLVYRRDLFDAIRRGPLVPFHYFGMPGPGFEEKSLSNALQSL